METDMCFQDDFYVHLIIIISMIIIIISLTYRIYQHHTGSVKNNIQIEMQIPYLQNNSFPRRKFHGISHEIPNWYLDFVQTTDKNLEGTLNFPKDQIYQYIDLTTLTTNNLSPWLPT